MKLTMRNLKITTRACMIVSVVQPPNNQQD